MSKSQHHDPADVQFRTMEFWGGICCLLILRGPQLMDLSPGFSKRLMPLAASGFYWEALHGITWNCMRSMKCDVGIWQDHVRIMFESPVDRLIRWLHGAMSSRVIVGSDGCATGPPHHWRFRYFRAAKPGNVSGPKSPFLKWLDYGDLSRFALWFIIDSHRFSIFCYIDIYSRMCIF